jgi:glycosyltransferase involved in cell wall biosynthesis
VIPVASIVVPTRARPDYLEIALASLSPQTISLGAEIVVVDDGAVPANRASARRHGARYIPHERPRGPNAARNTGIEASDADLVVFVDDDVEAPNGWLDNLLAGAELYADHDVLGGPIWARLEGSHLRMCGREGPPITALDLGPRDIDAPLVWSANMLVRRAAFARVGLFDPTLDIYGDEEEWQRRYKAAGGLIKYVAAAGLHHRRAGRDAHLPALARAAWKRGRHSRRFDERKGTAPPVGAEVRTLAGCLWHIPRRLCGNGVVLSVAAAGRLTEALGR